AVSAPVLRIAWKNHAGGGIAEYGAMHVLGEQSRIKMMDLSVLAVLGGKWLPPYAIVQRQARIDFPGILGIERDVILTVIKAVNSTLAISDCLACQKVSHPESGDGAVESETADGVEARPVVHPLPVKIATKSKL